MADAYSIGPSRAGTSEANIGPWMLTEPAADSVRESESDTMTVAVLAGDDKATRDLLANAPVIRSAAEEALRRLQGIDWWLLISHDVIDAVSDAVEALKRGLGQS
jgi:hypothetical protein